MISGPKLQSFFYNDSRVLGSCVLAISKFKYPSGNHPATRFAQDLFSFLAILDLKNSFNTAYYGKKDSTHALKNKLSVRSPAQKTLKRIKAVATLLLDLTDVIRLVQFWGGRKVLGARVDALYTALDLTRLALSLLATRHGSKRPFLVVEAIAVLGENSILSPTKKLALSLIKIIGTYVHYTPKEEKN